MRCSGSSTAAGLCRSSFSSSPYVVPRHGSWFVSDKSPRRRRSSSACRWWSFSRIGTAVGFACFSCSGETNAAGSKSTARKTCCSAVVKRYVWRSCDAKKSSTSGSRTYGAVRHDRSNSDSSPLIMPPNVGSCEACSTSSSVGCCCCRVVPSSTLTSMGDSNARPSPYSSSRSPKPLTTMSAISLSRPRTSTHSHSGGDGRVRHPALICRPGVSSSKVRRNVANSSSSLRRRKSCASRISIVTRNLASSTMSRSRPNSGCSRAIGVRELQNHCISLSISEPAAGKPPVSCRR
ncbi:hypothetical protein DQ04_15131000 [Trypanosoma grayi]|uniref:hypothetical protein n=1 Tax=Trypanosoma grayi TaxID=71804 RepID=UPI0004F434B7|nr:hypothetical protein DQ04_15131000 [Trypanosoma grayi]KEG06228.1 hypothetical protein DQ04_15131000 [Trypanosoma grayi]